MHSLIDNFAQMKWIFKTLIWTTLGPDKRIEVLWKPTKKSFSLQKKLDCFLLLIQRFLDLFWHPGAFSNAKYSVYLFPIDDPVGLQLETWCTYHYPRGTCRSPTCWAKGTPDCSFSPHILPWPSDTRLGRGRWAAPNTRAQKGCTRTVGYLQRTGHGLGVPNR